MTRGTTPNLIFNFCNDIDFSLVEKAIVTFTQNGEILFNKEADIASDIKDNKLTIKLSQEDTLLMSAGSYVQYQVRLLVNGEVFATPIYKSIVYDTLSDEILVASETPTASTDEVLDSNSVKPCYATANFDCNEICATVGDVMRMGGKDGKDGKDGITPHIGEDGYWYFGEDKTDYKAVGTDGKDGLNGTNGSNGENGADGQDGFSPTITEHENTQNSYILSITNKDGSFNTPNLKANVEGIGAIYRFSESSVSSSFSGTTELYKTDLIGNGSPREGDSVLFPDNKSNVMFIGTITHVNDETYTIDNIKYINEAIKASGDWVMGVTANFPEMYNYEGGTWLCLTRDVVTAPEKGKEWFCISAPNATLSLTDGENTVQYNGTEEKTVNIPRPIYFKLNGDLMQDTGGVDTDYTLAISNLTPQSPTPVVGDIVVFRTSDYAYVGTVKAAQSAGIIVTVKLQIGGLIY